MFCTDGSKIEIGREGKKIEMKIRATDERIYKYECSFKDFCIAAGYIIAGQSAGWENGLPEEVADFKKYMSKRIYKS